ncbi:MAG: histidine kinase [Ferruginibacter sp.]|nr:histidine kinase [Ferruginibacter sp.]
MGLKKQIFVFCIYILLVFFTLAPNNVFAQLQPNYIQLQTERGLQSNSIYNLYVAKNGLLYIAHSKGLSSFDGNNFTNYYNKDRPFTEMTNIMETDNGDIFCKAFNNALFRKIGDSLRWFISIMPYSYGFTASSSFKNDVYSITNDSIVVFNANTNSKTAIGLNTSLPLIDNQKIQFIGASTFNGKPAVFIVNDNKKIFHFVSPTGGYHYSNGDLFFVQNKSITDITYYNQNEKIKIFAPQKNISVNYIFTTDSAIWICTTNGLFYRNKFNKQGNFKYILTGYDVTDVKQTKEGNYFVSTIGQGLLFIPNFNVNKLNNVPSNITTISGFKNQLLLGTKESTVLTYDAANSNLFAAQKIENGTAIKFLLKNNITSPLFVSNSSTNIAGKEYPFIIKDYCVVKDNIVLATNSGIFLYEKRKTNHWIHKYVIPSPNTDNQIKKLSFSNEHTSTIKYNSENDRFYINNYSGVLEMADNYIDAKKMPEPDCVLKDMCIWNGELLLASKDKGILKWNGKNYEAAFTKNQTTGILYKFETYKNELWVLGEESIFCYKNDKLIVYNNNMGINADNVRGIYITENEVYANNGNSVIQFSKQNTENKITEPVFMLNKVINVSANESINQNTTLSYKDNFISFQFSLIAYANAANTHIAYSINNKDLVHLPGNRREINLDFLKPENYTVEFYIVSNDIASLKPIHTFSFSIAQPFYNTWWFYLLGMLAIAALIFYVVKRKIAKERAELALKESKLLLEKELDKTTLSSIKAQMNPHFIFNALNTIQSYVYMNDKQKTSIYISKFSDLTRSILDMSTRDTITVNEEVHALELYLSLEKMRFEDSFEYSIAVDENVDKDKIELPAMLIQPYVENAVKHGLLHRKANRILKINFKKENNFLTITVDDNGIGRKKNEELKAFNQKRHTSFAMEANKKRMDILLQQHKEIYLEIVDKYADDGEALGTLVLIKLPI